jgi:20S proteasome alpha/beta subunit
MTMLLSPLLTSFALVACILLLLPHIYASSAPWQSKTGSNSNNNKNAEEDFYKNLPPTVFSGNGRLHSVERMAEAASNPDDASSNVAVAICYDGGVVVVSSSTKSPHLDDDNCTVATLNNATVMASTNTTTSSNATKANATKANATYFPLLIPVTVNPPYQVGPNVYATTGGNAADSQLLRDQILQISSLLWESRTGSATAFVPPSLLARHVADHLQRPTQQMSSGKILAVSNCACISLIVGFVFAGLSLLLGDLATRETLSATPHVIHKASKSFSPPFVCNHSCKCIY